MSKSRSWEDWDDLRYFLAVMRHKTFSGAARSLNVRQPTVSRRIQNFQTLNGSVLGDFKAGQYEATPLGQRIYELAQRIDADVEAAKREITENSPTLKGPIRVTTIETLAIRIIGPALARFNVTHPEIVTALLPDPKNISLLAGIVDIAIRMRGFQDDAIEERRIGTMQMGLYASNEYLKRLELTKASHSLVAEFEDQSDLPESKWLVDAFPDARVVFRSNSREVKIAAVREGAGIAALPCYCVKAMPDLVDVRPEKIEQLNLDIWLGYLKERRFSARIKAVVEAISVAIQADDSGLKLREI
jgi:DNA-binding transcriptional LysR family regulator